MLFTMTQLFCVSCRQILIARFHKVMVGFTRVGFTFEVGGILKTLLGFFLMFVLVVVLNKGAFILLQKCQSH